PALSPYTTPVRSPKRPHSRRTGGCRGRLGEPALAHGERQARTSALTAVGDRRPSRDPRVGAARRGPALGARGPRDRARARAVGSALRRARPAGVAPRPLDARRGAHDARRAAPRARPPLA